MIPHDSAHPRTCHHLSASRISHISATSIPLLHMRTPRMCPLYGCPHPQVRSPQVPADRHGPQLRAGADRAEKPRNRPLGAQTLHVTSYTSYDSFPCFAIVLWNRLTHLLRIPRYSAFLMTQFYLLSQTCPRVYPEYLQIYKLARFL